MMKRIISFLLALVICLTCLPDVRLQARANDDEIPEATAAPEIPTEVATETPAPQVVSEDWTDPYKKEYIVNQEKLDTTGCTLTLTYDDGSQEVYDITPDMVSGFDNTVLGHQKLAVNCNGYYYGFGVTVIEEPKPQHIYFNGWEIKNAYPQGAPLDLTDGVVEVFYDNGSWESIPATDPSVTVSGYDPNLLGTQILTVSYMGLTTEFRVTVYTYSGQCGDDLQFSFEEATGTLTITGSGAMHDFDWEMVPWRGYEDRILKVELPSGLTTLGTHAFGGCYNMNEINLPQGLERIGDHALEECHNLTSLTIPSSVKYIGVYAVCGVGLMELVLPEGLETIDMYAFMGCHSLNKVVLPKSLKTLGGGAFQYCGNLETAELPETLDVISWHAFNECNSLQDILIPKSVTEISYFAFNSCTAMQDVVFEGSAPTVDAGMTGDMYPFQNVTSEAWYPAGDATWTPAAMAAMGGNLTWTNGESMPSGTCGGDLTWYLDASHTLHISGTGEMESYSHYSAPWNGNTVYRVVVHPGVTTIGSDAFYDMKEIVEVQLPDTLLSIGSGSFQECDALKKITFPDSLEEISWLAFAGCSGLESIVIPGTVNVGGEAFASCTGLTEVILGDGFTDLGNEVFSNCASLKTVVLPEGLKTIGTGTFTACPALTEITIPSTVTEIHSSAFGRNRLEKSVTIDPEKTITFTGDAPEMEDGAFSGSVIIAQYPFGNLTWTADKMQDYGGTVTWVPTGSVAGTCGKNLSWTLENGVLTISGTGEMYGFPGDNPAPWSAYHTFIEKVVVESGVTAIGSYAFYGPEYPGYANITELLLPDTLVSVGESAFEACSGLTSLTVPGSVTKIGGGAFASCENLETVVLSEGLQIIGDAAFVFCSALKEITVPSTVTVVGEYAFSGEIGAEKTIHFTGNAPEFNENTFYEIVASVYYPADDATWTAEKMQNYGGTVIWIPDSGCVLSGTCGDKLLWVFDETTGTLTISGTGDMTDYSEDNRPWNDFLSSITTVVIEDGATNIGNDAFCGCTALTSVAIPASVCEIKYHAFAGCTNLTGVVIPEGVTEIGSAAFDGCTALADVSIPASVKKIGNYAFYQCASLTAVTLPEGLNKIAQTVFGGCSGLTGIVIPDSVTEIEDFAFSECIGLETIIFEGDAPTFGMNVFSGVTATAHCPAGNGTWTSDVMKDYGGRINWVIPEVIASGVCGDNLTWTLDETGTFTVSGTGPMTDYPSESSRPWYDYVSSITSVVIEDGVTSIGDSAFRGCINLPGVHIPDSVTAIMDYAFFECTSLTGVTIPASVTIIRDAAFSECTSLEGIWVEESSQYYSSDDQGVLFNKAHTTLVQAPGTLSGEYACPEGVTDIGIHAFWGCYNMTGITIPASVTSIDMDAFSYCNSMAGIWVDESNPVYSSDAYGVLFNKDQTRLVLAPKALAGVYTIPSGVTAIDAQAFVDNQKMTGVIIPEGVTAIARSTFAGCASLKSIVIPEGVTSIGSSAFSDAAALESVVFPESLTTIDGSAFRDCTSLKSVTIPAGVTDIGFYAFDGCTSLTGIWVDEANANYSSDACGVLCDKTKTRLIQVPGALSGEYVIPDTVTSMGSSAFYGCTMLTGVTISPKVKKIDSNTFRGCTSLVKVVIPDSVTSIGSSAFSGCSSLKDVTLPANVTSIGSYAFRNCVSLTGMVIPDRVTSIGNSAFSGCTGLTNLTLSTDLTSIGAYAFKQCIGLTSVMIPAGVTKIGDHAFVDCIALRTVTFQGDAPAIDPTAFTGVSATIYYLADNTTWTSDALQDYGGYLLWVPVFDLTAMSGPCGGTLTWKFDEETGTLTFSGSGAMKDYDYRGTPWKPYAEQIRVVELPDTLTALGAYAFDGCVSLRQIQLPEGIPAIPAYAFNKCMSLTSLTIPDSVKVIGDTALSECNSLTSLVLPEGVETVENFAFSWNSGLKEIVLPETLQNLNCGVFDNCTALESVNIPESLETINWATFQGCTSLKEVVIPKSVTEIVYSAFSGCTGLEDVIFEGSAPYVAPHVFEPFGGVTANAWYSAADDTWTEDIMVRLGRELSWFPNGPVKNSIMMDAADFGYAESVWIDGREYLVEYKRDIGMIDLPDSKAKTMVTYTYHVGDVSDVHTQYPVSMKVWTLTNEDGYYTVHRQQQLDDLLQYSGMSIRVYGKKGIRMITSIEQAKKNALTGAGLAGFTLKEYGTVLAWADQISDNKPLVLGKYYAKSNYAYRKGIADPVFNVTGSLMQYTNVLVNFSDAQCRDDIAMRPYIILEDGSGQQITLYGGTVQRSIGYIAYQNRNVFEPGTDEYEYVWSIIRYVYGTLYDDEYIVTWTPPAM